MIYNKTCQDWLDFESFVGSLRNDLDREVLEGILGSLKWHKNLWFILLTPALYFMPDLLSCTTKLDKPRVSYVCRSASRELRGLMEWSIPRIPSSRLVMSCGVATCLIRVHSACRSCEARIHSIQTEGVRGWTLSMQRLDAWIPFL
jgi:hypothetical protein